MHDLSLEELLNDLRHMDEPELPASALPLVFSKQLPSRHKFLNHPWGRQIHRHHLP
jgi:hypothetical protein